MHRVSGYPSLLLEIFKIDNFLSLHGTGVAQDTKLELSVGEQVWSNRGQWVWQVRPVGRAWEQGGEVPNPGPHRHYTWPGDPC